MKHESTFSRQSIQRLCDDLAALTHEVECYFCECTGIEPGESELSAIAKLAALRRILKESREEDA